MTVLLVAGVIILSFCGWLFYRFRDFDRREEEFFQHLRGEFAPERSPVRLYVYRDGQRVPYTERPGGPYDREREEGGV